MYIRDEQLAQRRNNFDLVRFLAAFLVFIDHSFQLFTGKMMTLDPVREIFSYSSGAIGVQVFFCLSGFLVARSLELSPNIWFYFRNRLLRIVPGLAGVIVLSVLVLGLFFSSYDFRAFLFSRETGLYLQNILVYRTYYYLPGVFEGNVLNASVNGSLWSIPYEFTCYLLLPFLYLFIRYRKYALLMALTVVFVLYVFFEAQINPLVVPGLGIVMSSLILPLLFFLSGACFYLWRDEIPYHWIGLLLCGFFLLLMHFDVLDRRFLVFVLPYLLFAFAFSSRLKLAAFGKYGDFSYGFYLYAFPVQQAVSALWAKSLGLNALIGLSFTITLLFAIFSWLLIEKPALRLKRKSLSAG